MRTPEGHLRKERERMRHEAEFDRVIAEEDMRQQEPEGADPRPAEPDHDAEQSDQFPSTSSSSSAPTKRKVFKQKSSLCLVGMFY